MNHKISDVYTYSASNIQINDFVYKKCYVFHNHMEHTVDKEASMVITLHGHNHQKVS